jgi:hypothetical protein
MYKVWVCVRERVFNFHHLGQSFVKLANETQSFIAEKKIISWYWLALQVLLQAPSKAVSWCFSANNLHCKKQKQNYTIQGHVIATIGHALRQLT